MDLGITGKVALVCGGSSGLGYAIAAGLLAEGAIVALNGRDPSKLDEAVKRLDAPGRITAFPADVSSATACTSLVSAVHTRLGGPDILLANSGGPPHGGFSAQTEAAWQTALDVSLLSSVHLSRAAVPHMRARKWGRVLFLTSTAAKQPAAGLILSTMARAGVLGFSKALADEVAADGITVNALCPGYFSTDRLVHLAETRGKAAAKSADAVLTDMAAAVPIKRIGTPEEFASAAVFLASEPARYITGVALNVDGGLTRSIV